MKKYDAKILDELGIEEIGEIEDEYIDFKRSASFEKIEFIFLFDNAIITDNPFHSSLFSIKDKEKIEHIFLTEVETFKIFINKIVQYKDQNISLQTGHMDNVVEDNTLDDTEVAQIIKSIITAAVKRNVSDIHILPKENETLIKFRDTGELVLNRSLPKVYSQFIINKFKTLSDGMDITNNLKPQDGKASLEINGKPIECRISTLPTIWGENCVLRVQQADNLFKINLEMIGYFADDLEIYRRCFKKPTGLILNVGATGSGKTTTFYLTIDELIKYYDGKKNIVTAEDPVEIKFPAITQVEVEDKQGRSFAQVLRSLMRQDPDIILIGEIRDEVTGHIAIKASLTGHAVLATLHANDSITAIARLRDLGISDALIAATGNCFISQKLVKKLCVDCKVLRDIRPKEKQDYGVKFEKVFEKGPGCKACSNTGYNGRLAVSEVLEITLEMKDAISNGSSEVELKKIAKKHGFRNLWFNGMRRLEDGTISLEDLVSTITRDLVINAFETEDNKNQVTLLKREIYYPIKEILVKSGTKNGLVFDITRRGISLLFDEPYFMEINLTNHVVVDGKEITFVPKVYGSLGTKFMIAGEYIGQLDHLLNN